MATAVLILDADRQVEYANASAEMLFVPIDPIGCTLPALFASRGATGDILALEAGGKEPGSVRLQLADDRLLDCSIRALSGGNRVVSIDVVTTNASHAEPAERDAERMQEPRSIEIDLRRALALKQFAVVYQPQFDLRSNAIIGFEALIRWHHPTRGIVPPAQFIPFAEETGVIDAIGEWVLQAACEQAATWPVPVAIAVNVSPVQFRSGRLLETVTSALAQSLLPASRLKLEITEGTLLENSDAVLQTLNHLRELGVAIVMDDFGTGYSSLGYLRMFPFDMIKIDQGFVRDLDAHPERQAFIRAVNSLAVMHGMKTVAEGVETEAELACIRAAGCDEVQGNLTGRPLSVEAAVALLQTVSSDRAR